MSSSKYSLFLFSETNKAWLVGKKKTDHETGDSFWLPKSQCVIVDEIRHDGSDMLIVFIPDWIAEKEGLDPSLDGEDGEVIE